MEKLLQYLPTIIGLLNNPQIQSIIETLMKVGAQAFPNVSADNLPAAVSTMYDTDRVKWIQTALKILGYDVPQDGTLDDATKTAVKDFQSKQGLIIDGWPGPLTSAKLRDKIVLGPPY